MSLQRKVMQPIILSWFMLHSWPTEFSFKVITSWKDVGMMLNNSSGICTIPKGRKVLILFIVIRNEESICIRIHSLVHQTMDGHLKVDYIAKRLKKDKKETEENNKWRHEVGFMLFIELNS